jgi:hypothetical protein
MLTRPESFEEFFNSAKRDEESDVLKYAATRGGYGISIRGSLIRL